MDAPEHEERDAHHGDPRTPAAQGACPEHQGPKLPAARPRAGAGDATILISSPNPPLVELGVALTCRGGCRLMRPRRPVGDDAARADPVRERTGRQRPRCWSGARAFRAPGGIEWIHFVSIRGHPIRTDPDTNHSGIQDSIRHALPRPDGGCSGNARILHRA